MRSNVVLITGGSRGIGAATAMLAAEQGWDVCISYRKNATEADAVVAAIERMGRRALAVRADVSVEEDVLVLFRRLDETFGTLDALVNNAGVVAAKARLADVSAARLQELFAVNVIGSMVCAREAVHRMSTHKGGHGGAIVNVSSAASRLGSPNEFIDYASSKGAIDTMTLGLSKEVAEEGIRVNAVRPGLIDTDIHDDTGDVNRLERLRPTIPMQRAGTAREVAEAIVWLMSDDASYVSGALLDVAGGR